MVIDVLGTQGCANPSTVLQRAHRWHRHAVGITQLACGVSCAQEANWLMFSGPWHRLSGLASRALVQEAAKAGALVAQRTLVGAHGAFHGALRDTREVALLQLSSIGSAIDMLPSIAFGQIRIEYIFLVDSAAGVADLGGETCLTSMLEAERRRLGFVLRSVGFEDTQMGPPLSLAFFGPLTTRMPSANSTVGQFYAQGSLWRNQNPSSWRFTFLRTVSLSCESASDGIRILPEGNTSTLQAVADQIRRIDDSTLRLELLGANGGAPATVLAGNEAIAGFFFNPREVTPKGVFATISKTSVLQDPMVLRLQI